ncbi:MAG TPA: zinc ribbon domain-containing protein, partial [Solirubrobacteraceae bacterium]|nr:zinc ribbon domain-containing protein [Solirubrobacteraceae bacterium]
MDQTPATTSAPAPAAPDAAGQPGDQATAPTPGDGRSAGFGPRGRVRRRARFLRKARELAYRDLGGLVYSLHRFGQRNDSLVLAKLATLTRIDAELRALEASLSERQPVTVLREAGITACPRCAAIHSAEDRFCPNCGLSMSRNVDLPIAGAPAGGAAAPAAAAAPAPAGSPPPRAEPPSAATASFASVPAPAQPQGAPATQTHPVTPPPGAGSPAPPLPGDAPSPTRDGDDD